MKRGYEPAGRRKAPAVCAEFLFGATSRAAGQSPGLQLSSDRRSAPAGHTRCMAWAMSAEIGMGGWRIEHPGGRPSPVSVAMAHLPKSEAAQDPAWQALEDQHPQALAARS